MLKPQPPHPPNAHPFTPECLLPWSLAAGDQPVPERSAIPPRASPAPPRKLTPNRTPHAYPLHPNHSFLHSPLPSSADAAPAAAPSQPPGSEFRAMSIADLKRLAAARYEAIAICWAILLFETTPRSICGLMQSHQGHKHLRIFRERRFRPRAAAVANSLPQLRRTRCKSC
jgi:hypothetical protein